MKAGARRTLHLLRHLAWPELRQPLLLALTMNLVAALGLWLPGLLLSAPVRGLLDLGVALLLLYLLLPLQALGFGSRVQAQNRLQGRLLFPLSLPCLPRELWTARLAAALGALFLTAGAGWSLALLHRATVALPHPPLLALRSPSGAFLVLVLATAVPFTTGLLAGISPAPTRDVLPVVGLAGLALLLVPGLIVASLFPYAGSFLPPLSLLVLAACLPAGGLVLAAFERRSGHAPSWSLAAGGGAVGLVLVALSLVLGSHLSLAPSDTRGQDLIPSPSGDRWLLRPHAEAASGPRLWAWSADDALEGRRPRPLPGMATAFLGWGGPSEAWILARPLGGDRAVAWRVAADGERRAARTLGAPFAPPPAGTFASSAAAGSWFFDPLAGRLHRLDAEISYDLAERGARFAGAWGGRLLLRRPGKGPLLVGPDSFDGGSLVHLDGPVLPLRPGRWIARGGEGGPLQVWDDAEKRTIPVAPWVRRAAWSHHLSTLHYDDGWILHAWHPEVGSRTLVDAVRWWRLLPGGQRLLVLRRGRLEVVHAGTRDRIPLDLPPRVVPPSPGTWAASPDGRLLALGGPQGLRLVRLADGGRLSPRGPEAAGPALRVHWVETLAHPPEAPETADGTRLLVRRDSWRFHLVDPTGQDPVRILDVRGGAPRPAPE